MSHINRAAWMVIGLTEISIDSCAYLVKSTDCLFAAVNYYTGKRTLSAYCRINLILVS